MTATRAVKIASGPAEPAAPGGLWAWVRYTGTPAARDGSSPVPPAAACTAVVQDLSDDTLTLSLSPRIEVGMELHLELHGREQLRGWAVTACVRDRTARPGGGWLVNCTWWMTEESAGRDARHR